MISKKNKTYVLRIFKKFFISILNIIPISSSILGSPRNCKSLKFFTNFNTSVLLIPVNFNESVQEFKQPFINKVKELKHFTLLQNHSIPHQFILKLLNGRVWGVNGAIISRDDVFICDVSREFGNTNNCKDHSIFNVAFQKKAVQFKSNIAVISTAGCTVYYHWILDVLPRLLMLKESAYWDCIDFFVINYTGLPFQKETLKWIGVEESKIIRSNNNWDFHLQAKVLFTTSLPSKLNEINKFQCDLLRKCFINNHRTVENSEKNARIYISRKTAGNRLVVNENELTELLLSYGFIIIEMEILSVAEQVKLFYNASIIIGPHGSAFTNIIFCKPGSMLIDIMPVTNIVSCFYGIALHLNINYCAFIDEAIAMNASFRHDNIKVDIDQFKIFLERAILFLN